MCEFPNYDKEFTRSRLRDCAFTSFTDSSNINEKNLSKEEHLALKDLIKNRYLVIQKADDGNTIFILNKNDSPKFQKLSIDENKVFNHIVHMENKIIGVLKKLKKKKIISEKKYEDLYPVGSRPGILCCRAQIHKPIKDGVPSLRPILPAIRTPTYKLSEFFVPLLTLLTLSGCTTKDSFSFVAELSNSDSNLVMASFNVESLFTNIPLQETIELCADLLFSNKPNIDGFTKTDFHELLTITMSESLVLFNNEYYKQIDGVTMGSPLGPTLLNIFLSNYEQIWFKMLLVYLNLS